MSDLPIDPGASTAIERAVAAYVRLGELAEQVEEEWQYVTDLQAAYLPALRRLGDPDRSLSSVQVAALDQAAAEIALIGDPHRAIDWLSTFPHVVALALGGDVDEPEPGEPDSGETPAEAGEAVIAAEPESEVDDSPFRFLLGRDR